jgi:large subunit ribosomal protein L25
MDATLTAKPRDTRGKNEARRLRAAGQLPAVLYGTSAAGEKNEPLAISVDPKALLRILHSDSGANTLIALSVEGGSGDSRVLVKDYQLDPITHKLLHADFYKVAMDRLLTLTVPIVLKGEPRGVKLQGGMLDFVNRDVEIECLPADIPEHIEVDVTDLELHGAVRMRDLAERATWKAVSDLDLMIVHVVAPRAEEPAPAVEAAPAPAAEPEVIKKGKPEKEE